MVQESEIAILVLTKKMENILLLRVKFSTSVLESTVFLSLVGIKPIGMTKSKMNTHLHEKNR